MDRFAFIVALGRTLLSRCKNSRCSASTVSTASTASTADDVKRAVRGERLFRSYELVSITRRTI